MTIIYLMLCTFWVPVMYTVRIFGQEKKIQRISLKPKPWTVFPSTTFLAHCKLFFYYFKVAFYMHFYQCHANPNKCIMVEIVRFLTYKKGVHSLKACAMLNEHNKKYIYSPFFFSTFAFQQSLSNQHILGF